MTNVQELSPVTTSAPGYYITSATSDTSGITDFVFTQAATANSSQIALIYKAYDDAGVVIAGPVTVDKYVVPATDVNTGAVFDNQLATFDLGNGSTGVFYTQDAKTSYGPSDKTALKLQEFDAAGNPMGSPVTLDLGGKAATKDLYQVDETGGAEFGSAFVVTYSVFDPATGADTIAYEKFDDGGTALGGAVLDTINDGGPHDLDFGTFYSAANPKGSPDYLLMNRSSGSQNLRAVLYDTDLNQVVAKTITDRGPEGEASTSLDYYSYLGPGTGSGDNFAVLSQTFEYQDASGATNQAIALEKVNPSTLKVEKKIEFADVNGSQTEVGLEHLGNGNIVAAYDDGGQTYLQEYDKNLVTIGQRFALPHDSDGYDGIASIGGDSVQIFWRDNAPNSNKTVQHSALFQF